MTDALKPRDAQEVEDAVRWALGNDKALEVTGQGSKRAIGRPSQTDLTLELSGLSGVTLYEPAELVLSAKAGTPLAEIEALLEKNNQELAFEPMDYGPLLGLAAGLGTIGGTIATNLSGPRRIKAGAARDHVLGIRGVSGRGEVFKAGARVVKNVTGYDLPKLLTGSYGTLAALTSITVKVLPRPETEETILVEGLDDTAAVPVMSLAMQSACEVSGAAHVPGEGTFLRLEGIAASVAARRDGLAKLLARPVQILAAKASGTIWQRIRDVLVLADTPDRQVWRLSVTPSDAPALLAKLRGSLEIRYVLDWAGGLIWLDVPPTEDAAAAVIRGAMRSGHATLIRAPEGVRAAVDVFHPQAPALAALSARVKDSFDPRQLFNPGRMSRGL